MMKVIHGPLSMKTNKIQQKLHLYKYQYLTYIKNRPYTKIKKSPLPHESCIRSMPLPIAPATNKADPVLQINGR